MILCSSFPDVNTDLIRVHNAVKILTLLRTCSVGLYSNLSEAL